MMHRIPEAFILPDLPRSTNRRQMQTAMQFMEHAVKTELTDRQRSVFLLYVGENLTMQQIAERLGLTRGTVCKHLHKAISRLQHAAQLAGFTDPQLRS